MALIIPKKSAKKIRNLKLDISDLFLKRNALINKKVRQISNIDLDLSPLKNELEIQFDQLEALINETDASFEGAVKAQKSKQFKGIDHLEQRLLKAQKKKLEDQVERLVLLHEQLFPGGNLQERVENFSTFQIEQDNDFNSILMEVFDPLSKEFTFIEI
jgi:predicted nuclease with TOPRIM domain